MKIRIVKRDKNVFLNILTIIILVMSLFAIGLITMISTSGLHLYMIILGIMIFFFAAGTVYLLGLVLLIIRITKEDSIPKFLIPLFEKSIKFMYPIMIMFSNVLKIDKDPIRRFFSEINNKIVVLKCEKMKPEDILMIAPHCLQKSFCKHKVTGDINNCKRCGKCDINMLLDISTSYNIRLEIVTGGTLARKIIQDYKPKGIIAIACERDLSHGILDIKSIPVIGVKNERPEGPCHNTCVDIKKVEKAIKHFLGRE